MNVARISVYGDPTGVSLYKGFDSSKVWLVAEKLPATDVAVALVASNIGLNAATTVEFDDKVIFESDEDEASFTVKVTDAWDNTLSETVELTLSIDAESTDAASFSVATATLTFTVSTDATNVPTDLTLDCTTYSAGANSLSGISYTTSTSGEIFGLLVNEKGPVFAD